VNPALSGRGFWHERGYFGSDEAEVGRGRHNVGYVVAGDL
jgi:hypothetical protein